MSDQIIEEKIETEFVPNADGDLKPQTSEEKEQIDLVLYL